MTKMIDVELVLDREVKEDCRAGTGTVWYGKGDVQPFPEHLWPKLAQHPDVWKRVDGKEGPGDAPIQTANLGDGNPPPAERALARGEVGIDGTIEGALHAGSPDHRLKLDAIDEIYVLKNGDAIPIVPVTAEQLELIEEQAIRNEAEYRGYALNPRLKVGNLRAKFLEAQEMQVETHEEATALVRKQAEENRQANGGTEGEGDPAAVGTEGAADPNASLDGTERNA